MTHIACNPVRAGETAAAADLDFLTVSQDPALGAYIAGLFRAPGWRTAHAASLAEASAVLKRRRTAVVIFEELPDGTWQDLADAAQACGNAPSLIVVGGDAEYADGMAAGVYDVLTPPLRDTHVLWSAASAWHHWLVGVEREVTGGMVCSDA